ncbi:MAG: ribonuclease HII [Salinivirgaceae bacterium]|nr:ribonuclease HII [Salinivirgaceae bacterium]
MLELNYSGLANEAGCDEAGRGCLAGPVFAAAVILPEGFSNDKLNDSKQMTEKNRYLLRDVIMREAKAYAVAKLDAAKIDEINILNASIASMHLALDQLVVRPEFVIVDGNRFRKYQDVPHQTIVKGDGKYLSIAAASVLAKTFRDDFMKQIDKEFPQYNWAKNKGYPTADHRAAIAKYGVTPYHRRSFRLLDMQLKFDF